MWLSVFNMTEHPTIMKKQPILHNHKGKVIYVTVGNETFNKSVYV